LVVIEPPEGGTGEDEVAVPLVSQGLQMGDRLRAVGRMISRIRAALALRKVLPRLAVQLDQLVIPLADYQDTGSRRQMITDYFSPAGDNVVLRNSLRPPGEDRRCDRSKLGVAVEEGVHDV